MALSNQTKTITLSANCVLDGRLICYYSAIVDSLNPKGVSVTRSMIDAAGYREHREACLADQKTFEDIVYELADEMPVVVPTAEIKPEVENGTV